MLLPNDQAHPPLKAGATGGTTKAQAVSGRVQRLVRPLFVGFSGCPSIRLIFGNAGI